MQPSICWSFQFKKAFRRSSTQMRGRPQLMDQNIVVKDRNVVAESERDFIYIDGKGRPRICVDERRKAFLNWNDQQIDGCI